jgi:mono/diheme cytochrome c family protein
MIRILLSIALIGAALGAATFGILGLPGRMSHKPPVEIYSDRYMPGMDRQPKLRPMEPNSFFANGVSSQLPPEGTVAQSQPIETANGQVYQFEDSPVNTGHEVGTTNYVELNPLPVDAALIQRGRERFDIYCAPCHGRTGDGNGITKKIGVMPTVANLHDKRIVELTDGEIFNTITHGKGTMGAYGPLIPTQDRWAVIAYVRALQLSWLGTKDDLTPAQQAVLK